MLTTDSKNYEVLAEATQLIKHIEGMTCEIGVRAGGGSKVIIDALMDNADYQRTHICIDPYGHIPYLHHENIVQKLDYTNKMRNQCFVDLFTYVMEKSINVLFFNLEDVEFFKRFGDGVPVYEEEKKVIENYSLVHMDGPHSAQAIIDEFHFFNPRMKKGAMIVCDDISDYDHETANRFIQESGWESVGLTPRKQSYIKR